LVLAAEFREGVRNAMWRVIDLHVGFLCGGGNQSARDEMELKELSIESFS